MVSVVSVHDAFWMESSIGAMGFKRWLGMRLFVPKSLESATRVIVLSEEAMHKLSLGSGNLNAKLVYIPPPVIVGPRRQRTKFTDRVKLLMVNTIEPRKNVPLVAQVVRNLNRRKIWVQLDIVGPWGWEHNRYRSLIAHSMTSGIYYHGYVDNEKLKSFYEQTDFLISASLYEGTGLPYLEALGGGVPVIASDISASRYLAQTFRAVAIISCDGSDAIQTWTEGLVKILSDRTEWQQKAADEAERVAMRYAPKSIALATRQILYEAFQTNFRNSGSDFEDLDVGKVLR